MFSLRHHDAHVRDVRRPDCHRDSLTDQPGQPSENANVRFEPFLRLKLEPLTASA